MTRGDLPEPRLRPDETARGATGSPVLGRRQLARDLRLHRLRASRTIAEVAEYLECSPAKVSRIETGAVGVRVQDLRALVELYKIPAADRDQLYAFVRQARRRGWWHEFADVYPVGSEILYGLEDAATAIRVHSPSLVPGLLQTKRYARALIGSAVVSEEAIARRLELRMRRQELLSRTDPPKLHVVIDEAVIHHAVGGQEVMLEQLEALLHIAARDNVVVQVIEFSATAHPAAGMPFTLFGFNIPTVKPVGFQEQLCGNSYVDEPDQIEVFEAAWRAAVNIASTPQRSHELISSSFARLS